MITNGTDDRRILNVKWTCQIAQIVLTVGTVADDAVAAIKKEIATITTTNNNTD